MAACGSNFGSCAPTGRESVDRIPDLEIFEMAAEEAAVPGNEPVRLVQCVRGDQKIGEDPPASAAGSSILPVHGPREETVFEVERYHVDSKVREKLDELAVCTVGVPELCNDYRACDECAGAHGVLEGAPRASGKARIAPEHIDQHGGVESAGHSPDSVSRSS